jgi:hypothetical protein
MTFRDQARGRFAARLTAQPGAEGALTNRSGPALHMRHGGLI